MPMRNLSSTRILPDEATLAKLREKTLEVTSKESADSLYNSARGTQWFSSVIEALRSHCGGSEVCMYCSSGEPSQVEHYRPKAVFPELAFDYENYLWVCGLCNQYKSNQFPPDTHPHLAQILNPIDDNVWEHFYLNEFGELSASLNLSTGAESPRAVSTFTIVKIDRPLIQRRRRQRFKELQKKVTNTLDKFRRGEISLADLQGELAEWRADCFQADVPDYFLNGPGRGEEPFRSLLLAVGVTVPEDPNLNESRYTQ